MTITELKVNLASLTIADKAAAIEILLQTLTNGLLGIKKLPAGAAVMLVLAILAYPFGRWCAIAV